MGGLKVTKSQIRSRQKKPKTHTHKLRILGGHGGTSLLSKDSVGRGKQISEFEAGLVCIVSFRTARTIRETVSQKTSNNLSSDKGPKSLRLIIYSKISITLSQLKAKYQVMTPAVANVFFFPKVRSYVALASISPVLGLQPGWPSSVRDPTQVFTYAR